MEKTNQTRLTSDQIVHQDTGDMDRLLEIMRRLRAPDGCPWDAQQTFATIAPYTIEEAYEVADAIERGALNELAGELGDLLLQVVYHAQIATEQNAFTFEDIVRAISDKMVRRHPHVFGDEDRNKSAEQQTADWEKIKAAERANQSDTKAGVLDNVPLNLPALTRAEKLTKRAARVGFDWPDISNVLDKLVEETAELAEAQGTPDQMEAEFGDILFNMANIARHLKIDPEQALRRTNAKFTRRFASIEAALEKRGKTPADSTLEEMDTLWDAAKAAEDMI